MNEPVIPMFFDFHWPVLKAVRGLGHSATNDEIEEAVNALFTPEQQAVLHGDGPRSEISYRTAWARSWLKGMGLLDNPRRGTWVTTAAGRTVTEDELEPLRKQYQAKLVAQRKEKEAADADEEEVGGVDDVETSDWREELLKVLLAMDPTDFEHLAKRLLRAAGFINTNVTVRSGDGGIDGVGVYRLSLVSFPVFFQCKRYKGSVSPDKVRDFRGAMAGRGDKGLLITTGTFSAESKVEATRDGAPPIDLIDGERLCELLKEHGLGVTTTARTVEEVHIVPEFFAEVAG